MGGVRFPLLADFHPRGRVARDYGVWIEEEGVADRGTFLIGCDGRILWSQLYACGYRIPRQLLRIAQSFAEAA